jgi:hypothetical protein
MKLKYILNNNILKSFNKVILIFILFTLTNI